MSCPMREKSFKKCKQSMISIKATIPEDYNFYNNNSTFISPVYTFAWPET